MDASAGCVQKVEVAHYRGMPHVSLLLRDGGTASVRYTVAGNPMPAKLDAIIADLESAKSDFGPAAARRVRSLLDQVSRREFRDPRLLIRFHEALLFLRAFPQSQALVPRIERLLDTFHERVKIVRRRGADMSEFDDFDTAGIAGTTMQDTLNFETARWLARHIPRNVEIAWDDYDEERAWGATWPRFIPLLEEDADVEANVPWRRWLNSARDRKRDVEWLIQQFEGLSKQGLGSRVIGELYDSLRVPLQWRLENLKLSRTRNWRRPRRLYTHDLPLITRKEVSLAVELAKAAPPLIRASQSEGGRVIEFIREIMLVRYRELYGTTLGDPRSVVRADVGRGVIMYFWNLPPSRRLPLRAYVAGFTLKNGLPINYVEAIGLCDWIEVGFNTFYTYRQGETAWIYAQSLRCLCALTGAKVISVYPYQIGQNNDEALDSGAFWFYRKLGFRSGDREIEELARRQEEKLAANLKYRTSRRILKKLAEAHVFYELPGTAPGAWDTFATRNIGMRVNRKMAREFGGDASRMREASVKRVTRSLGVSCDGLTAAERSSMENWSMVLSLIPDFSRWTEQDKRSVLEIIRAQAGVNEMKYLKLTQQHERLRAELLRLGSS